MQHDPAARLPEPDPDARRHSECVAASLVEAMQAGDGSLSFGEFMQHALYARGLGYYAAGSRKFGAAGDFVTAPETSPLFGRVIARQCAPLTGEGADILEVGAGSGALALTLLEALAERDRLPARYRILEVSAELADRQRRLLGERLPATLAGRVDWLDRPPTGFSGVVIANEVADALPVERFRIGEESVDQLRVIHAGGGFAWSSAPAPGWLAAGVRRIEEDLGRRLPRGYVSELSPGLAGWIADLTGGLDDALVMLFDYGVSRREYYAPDRNGGWLRCHFRHRAHDDPLVYPGIQDLTAWVDFTAAAEAAVDAGLEVGAWVTQAHFLLAGGLDEELAGLETAAAATRSRIAQEVKALTLPGEMGEHFKCLLLTKGAATVPGVLAAADRSHAL